jgi:hypothetical protein
VHPIVVKWDVGGQVVRKRKREMIWLRGIIMVKVWKALAFII